MNEKEVIDYLQFCVLIYIAIFVTVIGFRQNNIFKPKQRR